MEAFEDAISVINGLEMDFTANDKRLLDQLSNVKEVSTLDKPLEVICRIRDVFFSSIALLLMSPIMLVIALAIYITSGKPIFFCQKRIGRYGKLFTMYKFRTMQRNAEEILKNDKELYRKYMGNDCKIDAEEDPRITKLGLFLRRSSLDELPQFINVLKGEITVVGPRPVLPEQLHQYDTDVEEFLLVKPGITGLWQVMGRSEIQYPRRKYLDLIYIRHRSLYLDFRILLETARVLYTRKGAY